MFCCAATPPQDFKVPPQIGAQIDPAVEKSVEILTKHVNETLESVKYLPTAYKQYPLLRTVFVAVVVAGVALYILSITGQLTTFPQHFLNFFQNINMMHLGVGVAVVTVLTVGAAIVIHRAMHNVDPITKTTIGKLSGSDQWIPAFYTNPKTNGLLQGYIDTSTLDENGDGKAFFYGVKACSEHYGVSSIVTLTAPLHALGAIVYNAIRTAIIPFYIATCIAIEKCRGGPIFTDKKERAFEWKDIPFEMGKSIWRIVKAPFFATAIMFTAVYSYINPMGGRKLGSWIERDWNEGLTRAQGYWSVGGAQSLWKLEGGGGPNGLGQNGFFVAGCWQPFAVIDYQGGKIIHATSLTKAVDKERGRDYVMETEETLRQDNHAAHAELLRQLAQQGFPVDTAAS